MGEQQRVAKTGLAVADLGLDRDARKRLAQRQILFGEGQRHQTGPRFDDPQPELPRQIIGQPRRPHLRDRLRPTGHHDPLRPDYPARSPRMEVIGIVGQAFQRGLQPQLGPVHPADQHLGDLGGFAVAEQLPQRLFMPSDSRLIDKRHKIGGLVSRQRRGRESRILRQESLSGGGEIGEIAPPPARDANLLSGPGGMVDHHHLCPLRTRRPGAEKAGSAGPNDQQISVHKGVLRAA